MGSEMCIRDRAGRTKQAFVLLSEKVLANLKKALDGSEKTLQRL